MLVVLHGVGQNTFILLTDWLIEKEDSPLGLRLEELADVRVGWRPEMIWPCHQSSPATNFLSSPFKVEGGGGQTAFAGECPTWTMRGERRSFILTIVYFNFSNETSIFRNKNTLVTFWALYERFERFGKFYDFAILRYLQKYVSAYSLNRGQAHKELSLRSRRQCVRLRVCDL